MAFAFRDFIDYYPEFIPQKEADQLYEYSSLLGWRQNSIRQPYTGKLIPLPRTELIYAQSEQYSYIYNGVVLQAEPFVDAMPLLRLRNHLHSALGLNTDIAIGNRYSDGSQAIGWHSDDKPGIDHDRAIVSVSLGATRRFGVRPYEGGPSSTWELSHGDVLVMLPGCQRRLKHCLRRQSKAGDRINWTFRPIEPAFLPSDVMQVEAPF